MLMSEPQPSNYDWRFNLFGFPVRVTWLFWAVSAALGHSRALSMQYSLANYDIQVNLGILLLIWVLCSFVSILVHELGHSFAFRYFGIESQIVLYQMGGLAIPGSGLIWTRQGHRTKLTHAKSLIISAAGPAIQILLGLSVGLIAVGCGIPDTTTIFLADLCGIQFTHLALPENPYLFCAVNFLVSSSIWWAVLNLVPIYPLDGGQIARHLIGMTMRRDGLYEACCISLVAAGLMTIWMYQRDQVFMALFFASMGYTNLQMIQAGRGTSIW
jgi:stage IV sporulation protein FB